MIWHSKERLPTIRNELQPHFSTDVLIYSITFKTHTIGWYDFNSEKWLFLNSENQSYFKWRYFINKFDKPNKDEKSANKTKEKNIKKG